MWICPSCERTFAAAHQSHVCTDTTIDDIFEGKPEALLIAFDRLLVSVIDWDPCTVGTSTKAIIFTKRKAWLIVKPMSKALDLKFYLPQRLGHPLIRKVSQMGKKFGHHIRISDESEITTTLLELLHKGYIAYD